MINTKNNDNKCTLEPTEKDPQRIKKVEKQYIEKLDYSSIEFPVSQKQYNKFEKQNNININVFGYEQNNHILFIFQKKSLKIK